jgi:hypothetical protein
MSPLRDLLIAPRPAEQAPSAAPARRHLRTRAAPATAAASLGVLAPARELPAVALAAGLAIAHGWPAALVCLPAPLLAPAPRAPARRDAARLAASLSARGLDAEARGRLAVARLPDDAEDLAGAAARALGAAGALPTVLAVAHRSSAADELLAQRDAILVALGPATEPTLAELALVGATELTPSAAALTLALDPIQRTLTLAACWCPRTIRHAVGGLVG